MVDSNLTLRLMAIANQDEDRNSNGGRPQRWPSWKGNITIDVK